MQLIDYEDLKTIAHALDIEGDYTALEARFRSMDGQNS